MKNRIAIERGLVLVPPGTEGEAAGEPLAGSLQAELMRLGYALDREAFGAVARSPREWAVAYHAEVVPHLRERMGAGRDFQPFYRNFPQQVMEMSHLELFVNALVHYWSDGRWEPDQTLRDRGMAFEDVKFRRVKLASDDDLKSLFTRLVSANQSLTAQDKATVEGLIEVYGRDGLALPETVPFKETLCMLAARGMGVAVRTATDVLRVAVYMSGGDVSMPMVPKPVDVAKVREKFNAWFWLKDYADQYATALQAARDAFKFRKFKRPERRMILSLLERSNADVTEMQRHLGRWLRLGEVLHPGEMADRFPQSAEAFSVLRNQQPGRRVRTFAARVDLAFKEDWRKGMAVLAARPGEFARRLDWMLRSFEPAAVLEAFERAGRDVSSKVLFELFNHFSQRYQADAPRVIMIKGQRAKMRTLTPLPPMERDLVQRVGNAVLSILRGRVAKLPPLGKVWIDERLKRVPVPFAMRNINTAVRTYVRGTRVPFRPEARVVRAFLHWFDEKGAEDLDLSAALYDGDLKWVSHVSFTQLKDVRFNCCHSGDVRHRQGPCAEYVDLDVAACAEHGVRYAMVHAYNYDGRPMHTVKECVFGLTERERPQAGEIFVPKTISNCQRLANEATGVIVCVIDLKEREYIWADLESDGGLPTIETAADRSLLVLRALVAGTKMSVYELLALHATTRGTLVTSEDEADEKWRWEDFVADYSKVAGFMGI
jgi:hypothetical protein